MFRFKGNSSDDQVNTFLLSGDTFMPEMHLKQPGFTYSACEPFTKSKERIQKFKACFQHDMAYGEYKELARRTASDKVLRDKAFEIASNPKHDGYLRGLAPMVYKFLIKRFLVEQLLCYKINN